MQHPPAGRRHLLFAEAHKPAAMDAKGRFAVDGLDGLALFQIAFKMRVFAAPPFFADTPSQPAEILGFSQFLSVTSIRFVTD